MAYNPASSFARDLETMPWYKVVTLPGFLLGRTDPAIDPKGVLTVDALKEAAKTYPRPRAPVADAVDDERLSRTDDGRPSRAGQLDAGFFYAVEAKAAGLPTIRLGKVKLYSPYTVTLLLAALPTGRAPNPFSLTCSGVRPRASWARTGSWFEIHRSLLARALPSPNRCESSSRAQPEASPRQWQSGPAGQTARPARRPARPGISRGRSSASSFGSRRTRTPGSHTRPLQRARDLGWSTATIATALIALFGIPLAYVLARSRGRLASFVGFLVTLPLALPPLMSGILLIYVVGPYTALGTSSAAR